MLSLMLLLTLTLKLTLTVTLTVTVTTSHNTSLPEYFAFIRPSKCTFFGNALPKLMRARPVGGD